MIALHEALCVPPSPQLSPLNPQYSKQKLRVDSGASQSQPRRVLLSCVPVYATQFLEKLCGMNELSSPGLNANSITRMPGIPTSLMNPSRSGVISPRSSAISLERSPKFLSTSSKNSSPGPSSHSPSLAFSALASTSQ